MSASLRLLTAAAALLASAGALNLRQASRALERPFDVVYLPGGLATRIAALGHRTFLSDLYWLQTVQYIGDSRADQRGYEKLLPLADLVTDLDPRHGYAYQTAGIVLSAVGRLEESNRILEKGMAKGPPYWTFPYYLAFNHWFYMGDYEKGAEYARRAAKVPGASPNISHLAVSLSAKTGAPDAVIAVLEELRASAQDEVTAERLDEQLKLAVLERDAQRLEAEVEAFRRAKGRDPLGLEELVWTGRLPALPQDPFGGQYRWFPEERKVRSTANAFRFSPRGEAQTGGFQVKPPAPDAGNDRGPNP